MDYCTVDQLKAALSLGESFADDAIASSISAASRQVDGMANRSFGQGDPGEVRYFTPTSPEYVLIDDAISVQQVLSLGSPLAEGADYAALRPVDRPDWPITTIRQSRPVGLGPYAYWADRAPAAYPGIFYRGYVNSVAVTGQFGWPQVPDVVTQATMILASRLVKRVREATFGVVGFGIEGAAVRLPGADPDVLALLQSVSRSRTIE